MLQNQFRKKYFLLTLKYNTKAVQLLIIFITFRFRVLDHKLLSSKINNLEKLPAIGNLFQPLKLNMFKIRNIVLRFYMIDSNLKFTCKHFSRINIKGKTLFTFLTHKSCVLIYSVLLTFLQSVVNVCYCNLVYVELLFYAVKVVFVFHLFINLFKLCF